MKIINLIAHKWQATNSTFGGRFLFFFNAIMPLALPKVRRVPRIRPPDMIIRFMFNCQAELLLLLNFGQNYEQT